MLVCNLESLKVIRMEAKWLLVNLKWQWDAFVLLQYEADSELTYGPRLDDFFRGHAGINVLQMSGIRT